jgi:hypothetical protein
VAEMEYVNITVDDIYAGSAIPVNYVNITICEAIVLHVAILKNANMEKEKTDVYSAKVWEFVSINAYV